ncbi:MAG TPA: hypothetical protein VKU00_16285 [Chthonomonadaceae bacterium]|nr:hypothetical protein [Chthonomonadaceae bacterium]
MRRRRRYALLVSLCLLLTGCGLGDVSNLLGGNDPLTTLVSLVILWQTRSRDISAPASALSATLTLPGAKQGGGDFTFTFDRDANLAAHSQTYLSTSPALAGTWNATVTFYANTGGQGAVVGVANKQVTLSATSNSLGDIATTGAIASVTIPAGQQAVLGQAKDLQFTALDSNGNPVAVSPGSAVWTVVSGGNNLQVTSNGQLLGLALGQATVTVMVDGKTSPTTAVTVAAAVASG